MLHLTKLHNILKYC